MKAGTIIILLMLSFLNIILGATGKKKNANILSFTTAAFCFIASLIIFNG